MDCAFNPRAKINVYLSGIIGQFFMVTKKVYKEFEASFSDCFNSICISYEEFVHVMLEAKKYFSLQAKVLG